MGPRKGDVRRLQRHSPYDDPFRKRAAQPRREAAVNRFSDLGEEAPWDPRGPVEEWTKEERRGAAVLRGIRILLWVTVAGAALAVLVALWRVFLAG